MAQSDEMTAEEACEYNYKHAPVQIINEHANTNEYDYITLLYLLQ
jgi:hypothetical protein